MNDELRALAVEDVKRTFSEAPKLEEIVKYHLRLGMDPRYVALTYRVDLARCERYAAAIRERQTKRPRGKT